MTTVPLAPLPLPRHATVALLGNDDDLPAAVGACLGAAGIVVMRVDPSSAAAAATLRDADVVLACLPWRQLQELTEPVKLACVGLVFVACTTSLTQDESGYFMESLPSDSVVQLAAELLPGSRVLGALQHFTPHQLSLLASGTFESDVLVTGDDREATDLVAGVIDMVPGLDAVHVGGLRTSGAIEGLAAVVREVADDRGSNGGFRLVDEPPPRLIFL